MSACDKCGGKSAGPRCPICVQTFGRAPLKPSGLVKVQGTRKAMKDEDRRTGD